MNINQPTPISENLLCHLCGKHFTQENLFYHIKTCLNTMLNKKPRTSTLQPNNRIPYKTQRSLQA